MTRHFLRDDDRAPAGQAAVLDLADTATSHLGRGEPIEDVARVLSRPAGSTS